MGGEIYAGSSAFAGNDHCVDFVSVMFACLLLSIMLLCILLVKGGGKVRLGLFLIILNCGKGEDISSIMM
jgi:hypothetical protein